MRGSAISTEAAVLSQRLVDSQNFDGGWAYGRGNSWAESTAFAILALQAAQSSGFSGSNSVPIKKGVRWLLEQQKQSGGWAPTPAVAECTSVSSVCALALLPYASSNLNRAVAWIASQVYQDTWSPSYLLARAFHLPPPHAPGSVAWYPGTAGWVTPTSLTAVALVRLSRQFDRTDLSSLANKCGAYLLDRRCSDGGWNHGGSSLRSENALSYPETTGLALLALKANGLQAPASAVSLAENFLQHPESLEGVAWLQMALQKSSELFIDPENLPPARTNRDLALQLINLSAQAGHNVLLG